MRPISRVRFDALARYARQPMAGYFSEELAWFEHASERVLGILAIELSARWSTPRKGAT